MLPLFFCFNNNTSRLKSFLWKQRKVIKKMFMIFMNFQWTYSRLKIHYLKIAEKAKYQQETPPKNINIWLVAFLNKIKMDIGYMWMYWQGTIFRQLNLLIWNSSISQFVHPVEGDGTEWVNGDIAILPSCENHFIRVHENLVQHPYNNISIVGWNYQG